MKNQISFDTIVDNDPTLKYLIKDSCFDFDNLDHQVRVRGAAIVMAIGKWINTNYK